MKLYPWPVPVPHFTHPIAAHGRLALLVCDGCTAQPYRVVLARGGRIVGFYRAQGAADIGMDAMAWGGATA